MSVVKTARRNMSFGGRMPPLVGALIAATVLLSIVGAVGARYGLPLYSYLGLVPQAVFEGQLWRLLTWVFIEGDPVSLVFGCLMLYWFGRDLAASWGERWFAAAFFGGAAAVGVLVLLATRLFWPELVMAPHVGNTPVMAGLVIVWALAFPERQIRLYFLFPMGGMTLVWIELGLTLLFALYYGLFAVFPAFVGRGWRWDTCSAAPSSAGCAG